MSNKRELQKIAKEIKEIKSTLKQSFEGDEKARVLRQVKGSMNDWLELAMKKYDGERSRRNPYAEIYETTRGTVVEGSLFGMGSYYFLEDDDPDFFDDEDGDGEWVMNPDVEEKIEKHFKDFMEKKVWYVKGKFNIVTEARAGGTTKFYVGINGWRLGYSRW